jgi:hypothetical protein
LANRLSTAGVAPPGRNTAALLGHSASNNGRTPSMVAETRGTSGTPFVA